MTIEILMPDEKIVHPTVGSVDSTFGGEDIDIIRYDSEDISLFARQHIVPDSSEIPLDADELIKAADNTQIIDSNIKPDSLSDICFLTSAKIEAIKQNTHLSENVKEFANGLQENIDALPAFPKTIDFKKILDGKDIKKAATAGMVGIMAANLAACSPINVPAPTEIISTEAPVVEVDVPDGPAVVEDIENPVQSAQPSSAPTETQKVIAVQAYPSSAENFILSAGGTDDRSKIIEIGGDVESVENAYQSELSRTGKNPSSYTFESSLVTSGGRGYWNTAVKDASGHYLGMKLTKGQESGQIVRMFGVENYIYSFGEGEDFFDFFTLQNPQGHENAEQKMIWDASGWQVVGLFEGGNLVGWFNADKGMGGEWALITEQAVIPEAVFTPEGFSIGERGLLKNPETGVDVLVMNPEADWERFREELIGALWEANVDWHWYTGESNDAVNYTKEAFIKAAKEGKEFNIGIPVRMDGIKLSETDPDFLETPELKSTIAILKTVKTTLDNIQVQVLAPGAFEDYTGLGWFEDSQEAYPCLSQPDRPANVCHFGIREGGLVISVGSFQTGLDYPVRKEYLIGRFDPALYEKNQTYFRPDGIASEADYAASVTLGGGILRLNNFPDAHSKNSISINIQKTSGNDVYGDYFLTPNLFIFHQ